jgi:cobyrinic acid a,c-diamide synthase
MTGLLGLETSFKKRKLHLGYRRGRLLAASGLGEAGAHVFGHEFHYASVLTSPDDPLVEATDALGTPMAEGGSRRGSVTGTFFHLIDGAE